MSLNSSIKKQNAFCVTRQLNKIECSADPKPFTAAPAESRKDCKRVTNVVHLEVVIQRLYPRVTVPWIAAQPIGSCWSCIVRFINKYQYMSCSTMKTVQGHSRQSRGPPVSRQREGCLGAALAGSTFQKRCRCSQDTNSP